jgi:DNA-binding LacI/PurR family transcriptional regulator
MKYNLLKNTIRDYLIELVERNRNIPNFKLPSENKLTVKFNCSRFPVRDAMAELEKKNYIVRIQGKGTFIAENLKLGNTNRQLDSIAVILPNCNSLFPRQIICGVRDFCAENYLTPILMFTDNKISIETRSIQSAVNLKCKGIILFPCDNEIYSEEILRLSLQHYPIVVIDRKFRGLNLFTISSDHYSGMFSAVKALTGQGYKNITFITLNSFVSTSVQDRIRGFEHAMFKYVGVLKESNFMYINRYTDKNLETEVYNFLCKNPETEVLILNSGAGVFAVLNATKKLDIKIPDKLRLALFDNETEQISNTLDLNPLIIKQNAQEIGFQAGKALYNQMYGSREIADTKIPVDIFFDNE